MRDSDACVWKFIVGRCMWLCLVMCRKSFQSVVGWLMWVVFVYVWFDACTNGVVHVEVCLYFLFEPWCFAKKTVCLVCPCDYGIRLEINLEGSSERYCERFELVV